MATVFHLLNVSDNANYGDLLFPLILERLIRRREPDAVVRNHAPLRSDWSRLGALPTGSYRDFVRAVRAERNPVVVVGGGGLLNTSWDQLTWRLPRWVNRVYRNRTAKRVIRRVQLVRRWLSPVPVHLPFVLSHPAFAHAAVFYNSVGAFPMDHRALDAADVAHLNRPRTILSVRDAGVVESMRRYPLQPGLVPDSALIMAEVFGADELARPAGAASAAGVAPYLFVQLADGLTEGNLRETAEQLAGVARKLSCGIVLSPIKYDIPGRTGDSRILKELAALNECFRYHAPRNVFETMRLIAGARAYLGTSLHGWITAYAFGVPAFGLATVDKLTAYIDTWARETSHTVKFSEIHQLAGRVQAYPLVRVAAAMERQKTMVYANLDRMFTLAPQTPNC
jgi:polysaccharide pyruvyl transferase WcaK-like protein